MLLSIKFLSPFLENFTADRFMFINPSDVKLAATALSASDKLIRIDIMLIKRILAFFIKLGCSSIFNVLIFLLAYISMAIIPAILVFM